MILQICFKWKHESAFIIGAAAITSHNGARIKGQNFYEVASELSESSGFLRRMQKLDKISQFSLNVAVYVKGNLGYFVKSFWTF